MSHLKTTANFAVSFSMVVRNFEKVSHLRWKWRMDHTDNFSPVTRLSIFFYFRHVASLQGLKMLSMKDVYRVRPSRIVLRTGKQQLPESLFVNIRKVTEYECNLLAQHNRTVETHLWDIYRATQSHRCSKTWEHLQKLPLVFITAIFFRISKVPSAFFSPFPSQI